MQWAAICFGNVTGLLRQCEQIVNEI